MIWRTFSLFSLDVQFYQQYMWFNHKQLCLTHSTDSLNRFFLFSRNQFIRFSLLLKVAEYCKQMLFNFVNNLQFVSFRFLNMCKVSLFCWIALIFYSGKLKFLYLSRSVVKLKYMSSEDIVQFHDLLQNVICSSQSLYDDIQIQ